jgi:hypothetical protein
MKYFFPVIITVLLFSCASKPDFDLSFSAVPEPDLIEEKTSEPENESVELVFEEEPPVLEEQLSDISETQTDEIAVEESVEEIFKETEEIAGTEVDPLFNVEIEITADDEPAVEITALPEPAPQPAPQPPPVQTPPPAQTTPPPAQQPPAQTTPPPAQRPQTTPPPAQRPQTTPPPTQRPQTTPPPVQPVQPPSLLSSAEERNSARELIDSLPPPRDPLKDSTVDTTAREREVTPAQAIVIPQGGEINFSRIVRATVGQTIEIPFNGTGWVYLGELASRRGIVYNSRRLDNDGQTFIFRAEETGNYALKFFRQDFIRDYILNDHVQVIIGEAPASERSGWFNPPVDRGRVVAEPRWPSAIEESELQRGGSTLSSEPAPVSSAARETPQVPDQPVTPPSTSQTPPETQPPAVSQPPVATQPSEVREILPPDALLQRAREFFDGGNVAGAISLLDQYAEHYFTGTDELYWLYGQFYEANTPSRNILLSLDYYRRLVREYPQSTRFNDARSRIAYLERYYINIQ